MFRQSPTRSHERRLRIAALLVLAVGIAGHFIYPLTPDVVKGLVASLGLHANLGGHHFVDGRTWLGIPNAADVLSNLPFAVIGIWGLSLQATTDKDSQPFLGRENFVLTLFFIGLIFTAVGSMLYHLAPSDGTLLWDRAGMAFAFAGMLGVAASERVSARSGIWLGLGGLLTGAIALVVWSKTSDVLPWMVMQFGSLALILILAITRKHAKSLGVSLYTVVAWYLLAKVFESKDHAIFEATGQWVSGHTLKHLAAACAAWPIVRALK
ncbi:MAG: hypothetical protein RLY82_403 [Pseudomonadota bacterium]